MAPKRKNPWRRETDEEEPTIKTLRVDDPIVNQPMNEGLTMKEAVNGIEF